MISQPKDSKVKLNEDTNSSYVIKETALKLITDKQDYSHMRTYNKASCNFTSGG